MANGTSARARPRGADAFGQALLDRHVGQDASIVIERDDGYVDVDETWGSYFAPFALWAPHQRRAIRLARGRVLDIGCGAGRVLLHLQRLGLEAVGVDISPRAVRVCRQRGARDVRRCAITELTPRLGRFDTLVLFGNNFGLLGTPARARRLLRRFAELTTPDARILAETLDPYQTDQPDHRAYQAANRRRGRLSGQVRIRVRYLRAVSPYIDWLFVSKRELINLVRGTGWRVRRCIDSPGPVYIAVLEKDTRTNGRTS